MCKLGWHLDDAITVRSKDSLPLWFNLFDMIVRSSRIGVTKCANRQINVVVLLSWPPHVTPYRI